TSSFDYSGPLTETVLMGNIAIRSYLLRKGENSRRQEYIGRKKLLWDGEEMRIKNLEVANQFVSREYRKGWELT
ncbi:MAG: gfo/Idh/MocA family oxidoreductase, partial [Flavobacteriaceae bacterium]|nr:gfo/Idh/MocA family oxidoreductase [Flavobacteriaceae bacterium]